MPEKKQNISKRLDRDHPVLSEDSPLNRHLCRAAGVPDVKSLLVALAHPMTEEDIRKLAQKAGNHTAHHNRVKHLREHAIKKHGQVGRTTAEDEEDSNRYPQQRHSTQQEEQTTTTRKGEDAGVGQYLYVPRTKGKKKESHPLTKAQALTGGSGSLGTITTGGTGLTRHPETGEETPTPGLFGRSEPGSESFSPASKQHLHLNAAGIPEIGQGPAPFRAKLNFNQNDPHEAAVHQTLANHSDVLTGQKMAPEDMGNHILFQDLMPDPHNPMKGQGKDSEERHAMAEKISQLHGGISADAAHKVLDRMHTQAEDQFNAHPLHGMENTMVPKRVRYQVKDPVTGKT